MAEHSIPLKKVALLTPRYAQNFSVDSVMGFRVLTVRNNRPGVTSELHWLLEDSLGDFSQNSLPEPLRLFPRIKLPVRRVAILSTTYLGYLERLGITDKVIAVADKKYISDFSFYRRLDSLDIPSVGSGSSLSVEALFAAKPDVVLAFVSGTSIYDAFPRMESMPFPVILTAEWMENTPLAKAEWLKFFGLLFGYEARAESLFAESEKRYLQVRSKIASLKNMKKPTVFTGSPVAGIWYASGGNSYMAALIRDAGGDYLWGKDTAASAYRMPLEKVFAEARDADIWLNPGNWGSREEGIADEGRLPLFKAWREERVYQYDLTKGPEGGLDFYETAVVFPEKVLMEVANIIHPGIFKAIKYRWYRKLSTFPLI